MCKYCRYAFFMKKCNQNPMKPRHDKGEFNKKHDNKTLKLSHKNINQTRIQIHDDDKKYF